MKEKKKIVFYSYKGGTGRTLALANVASYLARFDFKVCILDMDLEAPGIHYKFLKTSDPRINNMLGIVDYIDYFSKNHTSPPDLNPYLLRINECISIMPSGSVTCGDYWDKLSRINWHEMLYEEDSSGIKMLLDLLGQIQSDEFGFDFILIDARAGITPLSGLCVSILGDVLVAFFTSSPESLDGTRQMLKNVQETRKNDSLTDIPIVSVLTRFEKFENESKEEAFIADKKKLLANGDDTLCSDFCVIHADREIERNEHVLFGLDETQKPELQTEMPIELDYLELLSCLVDDEEVSNRVDSLLKSIVDNNRLINEPDLVQAEIETIAAVYRHKLIQEELIKIYKMRNIDVIDESKYLNAISRYYDVGGSAGFMDKDYVSGFIKYYSSDLIPRVDGLGSITFNSAFSVNAIFRIAENCSNHDKMKVADILLCYFIDTQYQKAFELYSTLLLDDQYSINALIGIMELFLKHENLYHTFHSEIATELDLYDGYLIGIENEALFKALFEVNIKYNSSGVVFYLMGLPAAYNYLRENEAEVSILVDFFYKNLEFSEFAEFFKETILGFNKVIDSETGLNTFLKKLREIGALKQLYVYFPKTDPVFRNPFFMNEME